jgi:hypothetical protein
MTLFRTPLAARRAAILGLRAAALLGLGALGGCVGEPTVAANPTGYGYTCYAGAYTCRLPAQYPAGAQCSCPGIGAPSYGRVN